MFYRRLNLAPRHTPANESRKSGRDQMTFEIASTEIAQMHDGSWLRRVNYVGQDYFPDRVWITGAHDASPTHNGMSRSMGGNYHGDCSACWYGHAHSEDYHRASLARVGITS